MRAQFPQLTLTLLTGLCACSSRDLSLSDVADTAANTTASGYTVTSSGSPYTTLSPAVWVSVDGLLEVSDGQIDTATSTLSLEYFDSEMNVQCSEIRTISSAASGPAPDSDTSIFGWWFLELSTATCTSDLAEQLWFGLGAWDPLMAPAADADGLTGENLYGLYVQDNPLSPLVVFGVAGSAAQFAGNESPITEGTLPDNTYQMRSLYLLPTTP